MIECLSRREFLKITGLAMGGAALDRRDRSDNHPDPLIGRVAADSINVFDKPEFGAETNEYRFRDEIINLYYEVTPPDGPSYNPLWYRIWGGYVHSAFIQPVKIRFNKMLLQVNPEGQLTEVTIPISKPYTHSKISGWEEMKAMRLYYGSHHWITDIVQGPDNLAWYQITDELWDGYKYYVPTEHLRPLDNNEMAPISPEIPSTEKRIEVSREWQTLTAFEGDQTVLHTTVSTGVNTRSTINGYPTITPQGNHNVMSKMPSKHMGSGGRAGTGEDFSSLPGVPWTSFFADGGYAIHGTYWHNNFGIQMSRGCVNMRSREAKWLFRWLLPENTPSDWEVRGNGTRIVVT